jgi:hypothetical protein
MRPRRKDVPAAVLRLIAAWPAADEIDRHVAAGGAGSAPHPDAVPYGWLKWKLRSAVPGEEHAIYNALRRTVDRMCEDGALEAWRFTDNNHYAWVLLQKSVTELPAAIDQVLESERVF